MPRKLIDQNDEDRSRYFDAKNGSKSIGDLKQSNDDPKRFTQKKVDPEKFINLTSSLEFSY